MIPGSVLSGVNVFYSFYGAVRFIMWLVFDCAKSSYYAGIMLDAFGQLRIMLKIMLA